MKTLRLVLSLSLFLSASTAVPTFAGSGEAKSVAIYENAATTGLSPDEQARQQKIAAKLADLQAKQSLIEARFRRLQAEEFGATKNLEALSSQLSVLSGASLEKKAAQTRAIRARLLDVDEQQREVQDLIDSVSMELFDFYIDRALDFATIIKNNANSRLTPKQVADLNKVYDVLKVKYDEFQKGKALFGQPKYNFVAKSYLVFFSNLKDFTVAADALPDPSGKTPTTRWSRLKLKVSDIAHVAGRFLPLVPAAVKMGYRITHPPKENTPGRTVIADVNDFFVKYAAHENVKATLEVTEPIPATDERTVNVYASTHRDPILDSMVMIKATPKDSLVFAAADQFSPKFIADAFEKRNDFVVVGRGSDRPIIDALSYLKQGVSRNIYIYPEGDVPNGFGETRPARPKFSWGLIQALRNSGYRVNIIPVTYVNNSRFMNNFDLADNSETLRVVYGKVINTEMIDTIHSLGDDETLNRLLRGVWLETLKTDEETFMGSLRIAKIEENFKQYLHTPGAKNPSGAQSFADGSCLKMISF